MYPEEREILKLRRKAAQAGDLAMVGIAEIALYARIAPSTALTPSERTALRRRFPSQTAARRECARVLRDMAAQRET